MDVAVGVLFAAFVIVLSTLAGRSLDRARQQAERRSENGGRDRDDALYGDF